MGSATRLKIANINSVENTWEAVTSFSVKKESADRKNNRFALNLSFKFCFKK